VFWSVSECVVKVKGIRERTMEGVCLVFDHQVEAEESSAFQLSAESTM